MGVIELLSTDDASLGMEDDPEAVRDSQQELDPTIDSPPQDAQNPAGPNHPERYSRESPRLNDDTFDVDTLDAAETLKTTPDTSLESLDSQRDFADYELLSEIARGGMGVVYRARQKSVNRIVALKMILSGQFASDHEVARFYAEAEAAAKLDHPHIVPIFDVGRDAGHHYFSMGFVDGASLAARIHEGPMQTKNAAELVGDVASAVEYAHQHGVIHRDLKPANILLSNDGTPRVTDFGLAKQLGSAQDLTATGQIMGTPSYMPPEQASGNTATVGPAADVYALGAILYALVTGRPPFQSPSSMETIRQVLEQEPVSPRVLSPEVDRDFETICLKCLQKAPAQRYESAEALATELARYVNGQPILARPVGRIERIWRWSRRNRLVSGLLLGIGLSLVLGICLSSYFALLADRRARRAQEGTQIALTTLETVINTVQKKLADVPAAREIRRELLRDSLDDLRRVSGEVESQSRVDRNTASVLVNLAILFNEVGDEYGKPITGIVEEHLERAASIYRELLRQDPVDASLTNAYTQTLNRLGNLRIDHNQIPEARSCLEEAITLQRTIVETHPDISEYRFRLAILLCTHGDAFAVPRDFKTALFEFQESVDVCRRLLRTSSDKMEFKIQLADALMKAGDACHDMQDNDNAYEYFKESLAFSQEWYDANPKSSFAQDGLSFGHERLGNHWMQVGQPEKALQHYESMLTLTLEAFQLDPKSRLLIDGLVVCYEKLEKAHLRLGNVDAATNARQQKSKYARLLAK